jgi:hypothetical protein
VDEQPLARRQAGLGEEGVVGRGEDLRRAARGDPVELVGHRHGQALVHHGELRLPAAGHERHHAVARLEAQDARAALDHLAGHLQPRDVLRRAGRGRIGPAQLQDVGAVDAGGLHADEQLARLRSWIGVLFDGDLTVADRRGTHRAAILAPGLESRGLQGNLP